MNVIKPIIVLLLCFTFSFVNSQDKKDTSQTQKIFRIEKNDGAVYIGNILKRDAREVLLKTEELGELFIPKHEIKSITEITNDDANQHYDDTYKTQLLYKVEKNDGVIFVGNILKQDSREILLKTERLGEIYIPKHEIHSIVEIKEGDIDKDGEYIPEEMFASRYFITTNSLPMEKGDSYMLWSWYGPDFQFGVKKNFGVGLLTSWFGIPIIGSLKYTINISEKFNVGISSLIGTGSYLAPDFFLGLPFATVTVGDKRNNLNFSAGYGFLTYKTEESYRDTSGVYHYNTVRRNEGRLLLSVAGMVKITKKVSLIFDSFIAPRGGTNQYGFALVLPGIRLVTEKNRSFQFGFAGLGIDYGYGMEFEPFPVPMISWFKKL